MGSRQGTLVDMIRLAVPVALGLILFLVWAYAIFDVITAESALIRNLPHKLVWLAVVGILHVVGAAAWFAFGRPLNASLIPGSTRSGPSRSWQQRPPQGTASGADGNRDWVDRVREARAAEDAERQAAERGDLDEHPDQDTPPSR